MHQTLQTLQSLHHRRCGTCHGRHIPATIARRGSSHDQTFPQAFPRQLSQRHAPANASNTSAGLSKATLAATRPCQRFKLFRRPFQGNSRSYAPQPSVLKGVQDCRLPAFKPLKPFRRPLATIATVFTGVQACRLLALKCLQTFQTLQPSRNPRPTKPSRRPFQGNSRSDTPQPTLQTLPQAFPRQLSQLHAPAICS